MTKDRFERYEHAYRSDYGFEVVQAQMRQRVVIERVRQYRPATVVEVGCGIELTYPQVAAAALGVDRWIIVEPGSGFAEGARNRCASFAEVAVVEAAVEAAVDAVRALIPAGADLVICAGLLHEVPDPAAIVASCSALLARQGVAHFSVPNRLSFHRRLGVASGRIATLDELSERNRSHMQPRVYDLVDLRAELERGGLLPRADGGYFVKPFTHAQMESIRSLLAPDLLDGLFRLGQELPDIASEIYVDAQRRP